MQVGLTVVSKLRAGAALCVLAGVLVPPPAHAHTRAYSYSVWQCEGSRAEARVRIRHDNLAELIVGAGLESGSIGPRQMARMRALAGARVRDGVRVTQAGRPCAPDTIPGPPRSTGVLFVVEASYVCPEPIASAGIRIHADLLPGLGLAHTHLLRLGLGDHHHEAALSATSPPFDLPAGGAAHGIRAPSVLSFFWTGVTHIAIGYDHLAFLLTLFLLVWSSSPSRRALLTELLVTATGFTVGHSITLALSVTGLVRPAGATVELLIAVSIIVLALESFSAAAPRSRVVHASGLAFIAALPIAAAAGVLQHSVWVLAGLALFSVAYLEWSRRDREASHLRRSVAAIFGLIHGFGFAGVLLDTDLGGGALAAALASFNVGVEVGQATILAALALLLWRLQNSRIRPALVRVGSVGTFWAACYWLGQRAQP